MRVKPKLVVASRELAGAVTILNDFENKHRVGGKTGFTQTLQFYLDALKFDQKVVMAALDQEVEAIKKELAKMEQLKMNRIKSVEVCMANFTNRVMEQPEKVQELSDYLSLPD